MKLLLDQNLSRKIVKKIARQFPKSSHVIWCDLAAADDDVIWEYARTQGFTIVTKDEDFSARAAARGFPPKVVWLRIGNIPTNEVVAIIKSRAKEIRAFEKDAESSCLVINR